jgi:hypothetical protein
MKIFKQLVYSLTKEGIEAQRKQLKEQNCQHLHWNMDSQIRTIECKGCGKRAWVDDYVSLYQK